MMFLRYALLGAVLWVTLVPTVALGGVVAVTKFDDVLASAGVDFGDSESVEGLEDADLSVFAQGPIGNTLSARLTSALDLVGDDLRGMTVLVSAERDGPGLVSGETNLIFDVINAPVTVSGRSVVGGGLMSPVFIERDGVFVPAFESSGIGGFDVTAVLAPGDGYRLSYRFNDSGDAPVVGAEFQLTFTAVPLPPAAWAAVVTLGGLGAAHWLRSRRPA
jgi:hypothetical protein